MKKFLGKMRDNALQLCQTVVLLICLIVPFAVDAANMFLPYIQVNIPEPDNVVAYLTVKNGNWTIAIVLFLIALWRIRCYNSDIIMNESNEYHDYSYAWYWYCAKILGIKKCNLALVPIYMQFSLVIRNTFREYPLYEEDYPEIEDDNCSITVTNDDNSGLEVNLVLEDTYRIESIPAQKKQLKTIRVRRSDSDGNGRHFSQKFIETIINCVRKEQEDITINVFSTTNPKHTMSIARRVFKTANRANVKHLYVFQQNRNMASKKRRFESKGHKIY